MDTEPSVHGRAGTIIAILVVVGIIVLGAGGYLAWSKRRSGGTVEGGSEESARWCQIRQEWQKQVDPLSADIMLKSVRPEDRGALDLLVLKRNKLANEFGRRLEELRITEPAIASVEAALIKEGKVRANTAVEIHNALVKIDETDDTGLLGKRLEQLRGQMATRIRHGRESADQEIARGLKAVGIACPGLYRGPATDVGTSDSPYITWEELELRRGQAQKQYEQRLKQLEPLEEYANRVYHELVRLYRPVLMSCHHKAKARNPKMSDALGLRVRLKRSGEVKTLAIEWMDNPEESFLDCLLEKASKWKLPRPDPTTQVVVVKLELDKL